MQLSDLRAYNSSGELAMSRDACTTRNAFKGLALSLCMAGAAVVGGCAGFDGVELQGGVFDALGMSGSGQKQSSGAKVEARPGLVLPPTNDQLPLPATGSIAPAQQSAEAWPVDPEDRRAHNRAELDKRHAAFCERAVQNARMIGESGAIMGPKGNCQPGLFGSLTEQLTGKP